MGESTTQRSSRMYAEAKLAPMKPRTTLTLAPANDERIFDDGPAPRETSTTTIPAPAPTAHAPELKLLVDRRSMPRRQVNLGAMAVFATDSGAGLITRVMLRDMHWTGVGLTCPVEVAPGSTVRLTPEHAMVPHQVGTVVRCRLREDGEGYDVGVRVNTRPAA